MIFDVPLTSNAAGSVYLAPSPLQAIWDCSGDTYKYNDCVTCVESLDGPPDNKLGLETMMSLPHGSYGVKNIRSGIAIGIRNRRGLMPFFDSSAGE